MTADQAKIEVKAFIQRSIVIADAVRDLGSVPSGHLYARVMEHVSLTTYQRIIDTLVSAKLITNSGHLLTWIGPQKGADRAEDQQ